MDATVISTRIRLARNVDGLPFPHKLKRADALNIIDGVTRALAPLDRFVRYDMSGISQLDGAILQEKHLISPDLLTDSPFGAALISADETVSVMVNEEDHIREQVIMSGLALDNAYDRINGIDDVLSKSIKLAYSPRFGYLTACATNLGTGMRASVMMFLPALTINGVMPRIMKSVARLGLTVRGIYGEGSAAEGYTYQISNEVTLGVTETEILRGVEEVVLKICKLEETERERLATGVSALDIQDECLRSYGILLNCAKLTTEELIRLAANVKLGAALGYIKNGNVANIDELVVKMRPSNIMEAAAKKLTPLERDVYRAQYTGKFLRKISK